MVTVNLAFADRLEEGHLTRLDDWQDIAQTDDANATSGKTRCISMTEETDTHPSQADAWLPLETSGKPSSGDISITRLQGRKEYFIHAEHLNLTTATAQMCNSFCLVTLRFSTRLRSVATVWVWFAGYGNDRSCRNIYAAAFAESVKACATSIILWRYSCIIYGFILYYNSRGKSPDPPCRRYDQSYDSSLRTAVMSGSQFIFSDI